MPRKFWHTRPPALVISNIELDEGASRQAAVQYEVQRMKGRNINDTLLLSSVKYQSNNTY